MVKNRQPGPQPFGDYANFTYLLTELELIIEADSIDWSRTAAMATTLRLEQLATKLKQVSARLDPGPADPT